MDTETQRQLDLLGQRAYTVTSHPAGVLPEHYVIRLTKGALTGRSVIKELGHGSACAEPIRETIAEYQARLGASVVVNASGGWGAYDANGELMGAQILNGQVLKDWQPPNTVTPVGTECVAFMQDGTLAVFGNGTSVNQILAAGAWNTFSQGAVLIRDGQPTGRHIEERYLYESARTMIGDTADGDLYLIVIVGKSHYYGADGAEMLAVAEPYGLRTLYALDGGGSTQLIVDGHDLVRSSDASPRPLPDVLAFSAPLVGGFPVVWKKIEERKDTWKGGLVWYAVRPHDVSVLVSGVERTSTAPVTFASGGTVCVLPPEVPRPIAAVTVTAYFNGTPQNPQNSRISTAGSIDFSATKDGAVAAFFSYPTV